MKCPHCNFETLHRRKFAALMELAAVHWKYARGGAVAADTDDQLVCPVSKRAIDLNLLQQEQQLLRKP